MRVTEYKVSVVYLPGTSADDCCCAVETYNFGSSAKSNARVYIDVLQIHSNFEYWSFRLRRKKFETQNSKNIKSVWPLARQLHLFAFVCFRPPTLLLEFGITQIFFLQLLKLDFQRSAKNIYFF